MIGKLERVPIKTVFPHEAHDLTPWLFDNIDVISDAIGLDISVEEREGPVGTFSADLIGEGPNGEIVIIENQFNKSDHDHLGKVITYVAGRDARIAIWIAEAPRPEHIEAINWLNSAGLCAFFLFKIEAVRIGESEPAPLLTLITGPSDEIIQAGNDRKDDPERYRERSDFWNAFLSTINARSSLFRGVNKSHSNYLWASAGKTRLGFSTRVTQTQSSVELYINTSDADENAALLSALMEHRKAIEQAFGHPLEWDTMDQKLACRIRHVLVGGYRSPREDWEAIHDRLASAMIALEGAIRPYLDEAVS